MFQKFLETGLAGKQMEPALGSFGVGAGRLRAKQVTGNAEPFEPGSVFGTELLFEFKAEALGKSRTFAVGGDGDLQIAALDDGAVVKMAVVDVVDGIAENVAAFGFGEDGGVEFANRSGGDHEECSNEIVGSKRFGMPVDFAAADIFGEMWMEFGRDDADTRASLEKRGNFLCGDGAAADDDDESVFKFEEGGEKAHRSSTECGT